MLLVYKLGLFKTKENKLNVKIKEVCVVKERIQKANIQVKQVRQKKTNTVYCHLYVES